MPTSRRSLAAVAVLTAAAMSLLACAPSPSPSASPTPTSVATSPEPTSEPTPAMPSQAFGGDCDAVVDAAAISAAMGEPMSRMLPVWDDGADAGLGGIECRWSSDEYLSGFATVWAYPVSVLDPAYVAGQAANGCGVEDESTCVVSEVFGDTWVGVSAYSRTSEAQIESLRPVLADIGAKAAASSTPVPSDLAGWWLPVMDCDAIAAALTEDGIPSTATDDRPAHGPVFVNGPQMRGCSLESTIDGEARNVTLLLEAGAGGAVDSVISLDPSNRVDFDGHIFAAAGEQYPIDGIPGTLLGSDGVNLASVLRSNSGDDPAQVAPVLVAVLAAIDR